MFKTLPNGAIELARKQVGPQKWIVLAMWEKNGRTDFVTWSIYYTDDNTGYGSYFNNLIDAVENYKRRR